jgi:hypothetical protein
MADEPAISIHTKETMTAPPSPEPAPPAPVPGPVGAIRRSASWFYWIAGLSLINVLTMASGSGYSMVLGTGISQITQRLAQTYWETGAAAPALALYTFTLLFIASFVFFGRKASQPMVWPFIAGMVLYGIDSIVFIFSADYVGIGFHAFVLYMLYRGLAALLRLNRTQAATGVSSPE